MLQQQLSNERLQGQCQMQQHPRGLRRRRERERKVWINISEDLTAEYFPNLGKETDIQVQEESSKQDQPRENHTKIHYD